MPMRAATWVARHVIRSRLSSLQDPAKAAADFDRAAAWLFKRPPFLCHLQEIVNAVPVHWISVGNVHSRRVILYFHGGVYMAGSGAGYSGMLGRLSKMTGLRVCAPDYRLSHQSPFPAAFDDARAVWDGLIAKGHDPSDIVLGGDSAGGGLMLALLSDLSLHGVVPAGCFAMSPWTDLTMTGESLSATSEAVLPVARMNDAVENYMGAQDPADPRASPLFAEFKDVPNVCIQVGHGEALLDDARRMAQLLQSKGSDVSLHILDTDFHVFQILDGWIPEARTALKQIADFVQSSFVSDKR
jgi:acetyl esterase/lipase